jgi:hypothetical protein
MDLGIVNHASLGPESGNFGIKGIKGRIKGHHTYFYFLFVGKSGGELELLKIRYGVP